jgi:hypothetical protein
MQSTYPEVLPDTNDAPVHEGAEVQEPPMQNQRSSQRTRKQPSRFKDYIPHDHIAFEALTYQLPEDISHPITAIKSTSDPDTMYLWEAKKEQDFPRFQIAMQKELDDHAERGNWKVVKRSKVPPSATILSAVWAMKHKRRMGKNKPDVFGTNI